MTPAITPPFLSFIFFSFLDILPILIFHVKEPPFFYFFLRESIDEEDLLLDLPVHILLFKGDVLLK